METLSAYIAEDRRLTLATGTQLPPQAIGVALFADVSGFTNLTETLTTSLGPRRGAEELSIHLNAVYEALVREVTLHGGTVVAFAGDAITCWFDGDDGTRGAAAAFGIQQAMQQFSSIRVGNGANTSLAVKVGLARGPVRRCVVGAPQWNLVDVIAGRTLTRMAEAAALAQRGEIIVAKEIAEALVGSVQVKEWRIAGDHGAPYAVLEQIHAKVPPTTPHPAPALPTETYRPYLLEPVFERLKVGGGEFLTELRPAVALFLKFGGIDYDEDEDAAEKLNAYTRWVQEVCHRFGGFLLAVGVGDKGSYLYCCFGAPIAHEDSAWRSVMAAEELRHPPPRLNFIRLTQIGVNSGTFRTGAYGSSSRRTYGVLGDPVNLAARLMEHAAPGQVLVTEQVRVDTKSAFTWQAFPPIKPKGKSQHVNVFALLTRAERSRSGYVEPQYALPLVGRQKEVSAIGNLLHSAAQGKGQVLSIEAEAGLGKSRLVAEAVRLARECGFTVLAGQCASSGRNARYLPWQSVWQAIFDVAPEDPDCAQRLTSRLKQFDPALLPRLPLLAAVLNVRLPDNELTAPLEARLRKASLEALLVECLRAVARDQSLLIIIEDCHWIDSLSSDLLDTLAKSIRNCRVFLVHTRRPPDHTRGIEPGPLDALPYSSRIHLRAFSREQADTLIKLKLEQLFGFTGTPPTALRARLAVRAGGNPFYLEELLNYLKDQAVDLEDTHALERLDLPVSLQNLVLSRIDRLTENQRATLKLASVVGRLFQAAVLWGLRPTGDHEQIEAALNGLCKADLTVLDRPEPEAVYLFKHVITQEVAYESLPNATRLRLHEQIGGCLERLYSGRLHQHLDLLAFHYDRGLNESKKREYLLLAGEAAQANYANAAAISYFERVLPLVPDAEQTNVLLKLGKVQELVGEWKKAGASYQRAFEAASRLSDLQAQARCQAATADLLRKQGLFPEATDWFSIAQTLFEEIGDRAGVGQTLHGAGTVAAMQGDYETASQLYRRSLEVRQQLGDKTQTAAILNNLGIIARFQARYEDAQELMAQSLAVRREIGDRWSMANSLNNIGVLFRDMGQPAVARDHLEEGLAINRQVGDRWAIANTLSSLGETAVDLGDWEAAAGVLDESLNMNLELGDRTALAFIIEAFAGIASGIGRLELAMQLAGYAYALREQIGSPLSPGEQKNLERYLARALNGLPFESRHLCFEQGVHWSPEEAATACRHLVTEARQPRVSI